MTTRYKNASSHVLSIELWHHGFIYSVLSRVVCYYELVLAEQMETSNFSMYNNSDSITTRFDLDDESVHLNGIHSTFRFTFSVASLQMNTTT